MCCVLVIRLSDHMYLSNWLFVLSNVFMYVRSNKTQAHAPNHTQFIQSYNLLISYVNELRWSAPHMVLFLDQTQ